MSNPKAPCRTLQRLHAVLRGGPDRRVNGLRVCAFGRATSCRMAVRMNLRSCTTWMTLVALLLSTAVTPAVAKDRWRHMAYAATAAAKRGGFVVCAAPSFASWARWKVPLLCHAQTLVAQQPSQQRPSRAQVLKLTFFLTRAVSSPHVCRNPNRIRRWRKWQRMWSSRRKRQRWRRRKSR